MTPTIENKTLENIQNEKLMNMDNKKHDVEINLSPQKGGIVIGDKFYPNMLVSNYWRFLTGLLRDVDVVVKNTTGIDKTLRTSDHINAGWSATVEFGTSNGAAVWSQSSLLTSDDSSEGTLSAWSKAVLTNEIELSISRAAANGNVTEVSLQALLYDTANIQQAIMLGRAVPPTPPITGQTVNYKLKVPKPWVEQFADFLLGVLKGENKSAKNLAGTTVTMRLIGAACVLGPVRLYAGTGIVAQAFADTTLTAYQRMSETYTHINDANYNQLSVSGFLRPTSEVTIGEVGLVGYIYDTAGNGQDILFARYVLPTPIVVAANGVFTAKIELYAP